MTSNLNGFTRFRIFGILSLNGENSRKSCRINLIFVVQQNSTTVCTFLNDSLMRMKILIGIFDTIAGFFLKEFLGTFRDV